MSGRKRPAPDVKTICLTPFCSSEDIYHALTHLAANGEATRTDGPTPAEDTFRN